MSRTILLDIDDVLLAHPMSTQPPSRKLGWDDWQKVEGRPSERPAGFMYAWYSPTMLAMMAEILADSETTGYWWTTWLLHTDQQADECPYPDVSPNITFSDVVGFPHLLHPPEPLNPRSAYNLGGDPYRDPRNFTWWKSDLIWHGLNEDLPFLFADNVVWLDNENKRGLTGARATSALNHPKTGNRFWRIDGNGVALSRTDLEALL